jgi:hypothetical protein
MCLPIFVAKEVRWEVRSCERDVHPLLPLLLVLLFVAHLHHRTHAVPMVACPLMPSRMLVFYPWLLLTSSLMM